MSLLYHVDLPRSEAGRPEAVQAEIHTLRKQFGGDIVYLMRRRAPGNPLPKWGRGLQLLPYLRQAEAQVQAHAIFHSEFFPFLYLAGLKKPIIYSIISGLSDRELLPPRTILRRIHTIVVTNDHDAAWLKSHGFFNVAVIRPGIHTERFTCTIPSNSDEFVLIAGSAPWTREQFTTKGTETLLEAAKAIPWLRIIFLWRGVLRDEMEQRIQAAGVADQVDVLDEVVDVNQVLGRAHTGVLVTSKARHVKAFPHSLIESLAAGKPVITSTCLPIGNYVEKHRCGLSINGVNLHSFLDALRNLRANYETYQAAALRTGGHDFEVNAMVTAYQDLLGNL